VLENTAFVTGVLSHIKLEDKGTWIKGSALLKQPGLDLWIEIKGVEKADRAVQSLPELDGQRVLVRGRLSSFVMKANPPNYPNSRVFYTFAVPKSSIEKIDDAQADVNWGSFVGGTVNKAESNSTGICFAEVALPYRDVKNKVFKDYLARVRCPEGITVTEGEKISMTGTISVSNKKLMLNGQTLHRQL